MKGPILTGLGAEGPFHYDPISNRLISIPSGVTEERIEGTHCRFDFAFDESAVINKLRNRLDTLVLEGTQSCQLDCDYCIYGGSYMGERVHQKFNMPFEVAERAISYFIIHSEKTRPFRNVSFYGGEPFTNFPLIKEVVGKFKVSL